MRLSHSKPALVLLTLSTILLVGAEGSCPGGGGGANNSAGDAGSTGDAGLEPDGSEDPTGPIRAAQKLDCPNLDQVIPADAADDALAAGDDELLDVATLPNASWHSMYAAGTVDTGGSGDTDALVGEFMRDGYETNRLVFGSDEADMATGITAVDHDRIYVVGRTEGTLEGQTQAGLGDAFLARVKRTETDDAAELTLEDVQLIGGAASDTAEAVAHDYAGNVYVAGHTQGTIGDALALGSSDGFVAKFAPNGDQQWIRLVGTSEFDRLNDIAVGNDGEIFVVGETAGGLDGAENQGGDDAFAAKLDAGGELKWTRQLGSAGQDRLDAVDVGWDGRVYTAGFAEGSIDGAEHAGGKDILVAGFSPQGDLYGVDLLGNAEANRATDIRAHEGYAVYVSGWTQGVLPKTSEHQANQGRQDFFVATYTPEGEADSVQLFGSAAQDTAEGLALHPETKRPVVVGSVGSDVCDLQVGGDSDGVLVYLDGVRELESTFAKVSGAVSENGRVYALLPGLDDDKVWVEARTDDGDFLWRNALEGEEFPNYPQENDGQQPAIAVSDQDVVYVAVKARTGSDTLAAFDGHSGELSWESNFEGPYYLSLAPHEQGVIVAGDDWLRKFDSDGNVAWSKALEIEEELWQMVGVATHDSAIYLTGIDESPDLQVLLWSYDASGQFAWKKTIGTPESDYVHDISVDTAGNIYLGGRTEGELTPEFADPDTSDFLAKYDPSGANMWTVPVPEGATDWGIAAAGEGVVYSAGFRNDAASSNSWIYRFDDGELAQTYPHKVIASNDDFGEITWDEEGGVALVAQRRGVWDGFIFTE